MLFTNDNQYAPFSWKVEEGGGDSWVSMLNYQLAIIVEKDMLGGQSQRLTEVPSGYEGDHPDDGGYHGELFIKFKIAEDHIRKDRYCIVSQEGETCVTYLDQTLSPKGSVVDGDRVPDDFPSGFDIEISNDQPSALRQ